MCSRYRIELARGQRKYIRSPSTVRVNELRTPRPFGFCLRSNRADHTLVQIDVLDLDVGHLYRRSGIRIHR